MKERKANATYYFVGIMITVLSFFIIVNFLVSTQDYISSKQEDLECRALVSLKEKNQEYMTNFLGSLDERCKADDIKVENEDKNSTLRPVADMMKRCWFRYGKGEVDFLDSWKTTGSWCFKCASIEFENTEAKSYSYKEFLEWMKNNEFETRKEGETSYYDYLNVVGLNDGDKTSSSEKYTNIEIEDTYELVANQGVINFIDSYENKEINPAETTYVTFRYSRIEKDLTEEIVDGIEGFAKGGGVIAGTKMVTTPVKSAKSAGKATKATGKLLKNAGKIRKVSSSSGVLKGIVKSSKKLSRHPIAAVVIGSVSYYYSNSNTNYIQYVEVMDREEYYRTCGTENIEDSEN